MLGAARIRGDIGQIDIGLLAGRQLDLGLLGRFLEPLKCERIVAQIHPLLFFELIGNIVNDALIEVFTPQEGIPIGGEHLELLLAIDPGDLDDRDSKGPPTEIIDRDLGIPPLLVHAIGQGRRGRLIDDTFDLKPGNAAGVFSGLTLRVVKVSRDSNDRLRHLLAQIILGRLFHLHQYPRRDLGWGHLLAFDIYPGIAIIRPHDLIGHHPDVAPHDIIVVLTPDQPLDCEQGIIRVRYRLPLGRLSYQDLFVIGEGHDRGGRARTFAVFDYLRLSTFQDGHTGIGSTEIYTDYLFHLSKRLHSNQSSTYLYPLCFLNIGPLSWISSVRGLLRHDYHRGSQHAIMQ